MTEIDTDEAREWDDRYRHHDGHLWSGQPNGSLVAVLGQLAIGPGRALDVGCGEGADAIWLAEQGWTVTGTDISAVAVDRARAAADERGVEVDWRGVALVAEPPEVATYDLVAISYPALRSRDRKRSIEALTAAVAPEGWLLVIGHHHEPDDGFDTVEHGFDPADYVSIDDIVDSLEEGFTVELDEVRDRPNPPADSHHAADRILLIQRSG